MPPLLLPTVILLLCQLVAPSVAVRSWSFSYAIRTGDVAIVCNGSIVTATAPVLEPHTGALAYSVQGLTGKRSMTNTRTHATHTANILLSSSAHSYLYQRHPHIREGGVPVTYHPSFVIDSEIINHSALSFDDRYRHYYESTDEEVFDPAAVIDSSMTIVSVGVRGEDETRFTNDYDSDGDGDSGYNSAVLTSDGNDSGWIVATPRANTSPKRLRGH